MNFQMRVLTESVVLVKPMTTLIELWFNAYHRSSHFSSKAHATSIDFQKTKPGAGKRTAKPTPAPRAERGPSTLRPPDRSRPGPGERRVAGDKSRGGPGGEKRPGKSGIETRRFFRRSQNHQEKGHPCFHTPGERGPLLAKGVPRVKKAPRCAVLELSNDVILVSNDLRQVERQNEHLKLEPYGKGLLYQLQKTCLSVSGPLICFFSVLSLLFGGFTFKVKELSGQTTLIPSPKSRIAE